MFYPWVLPYRFLLQLKVALGNVVSGQSLKNFVRGWNWAIQAEK